MKKVLIICYYFPPDLAIGSLRPKGIEKYIGQFNWLPIIITKKSNQVYTNSTIIYTAAEEYDSVDDFKCMLGFKRKATLKRQLNLKEKKGSNTCFDKFLSTVMEIISYPDPQKKWYKDAYIKSCEVIESQKIDAIISTSSPVTCHKVAFNLKLKYDLPWIADLRDLWTQNPYYPYSPFRKIVERRLEYKTFSKADALTVTTRKSAEILGTLHPTKQIYSIPNGFDPEYINKGDIVKLSNKLTITYTGSLYKGKRDPSNLFKALYELFLEQKIDRDNIEVRFYGPKEDWIDQEIEYFKLKDVIRYCGIFSRDYILQRQFESQLLLLLLWDNPNESILCPGKIYEYLAAQRPIIAIGGPKGVVSELLNETSAGIHLISVEDIKNALEKYYNEYKINGYITYQGIKKEIYKYSQKEMARKFSLILDKQIENIL